MQNTTVKTGKGWNWLWAAEKSYGGEESDQRLRAGNKPPEEGLEKLPAILEIVRSTDPISRRFTAIFTCDTMHVLRYSELFVTQF